MLIAQICFQLFGNSPIAKKYQLSPDKVHYSVNFGLGPHFTDILMESFKKSDFYVISFDESLNKATRS